MGGGALYNALRVSVAPFRGLYVPHQRALTNCEAFPVPVCHGNPGEGPDKFTVIHTTFGMFTSEVLLTLCMHILCGVKEITLFLLIKSFGVQSYMGTKVNHDKGTWVLKVVYWYLRQVCSLVGEGK